MTPQFPFKCAYQITQEYAEDANNYPEGHHGGLDIVPHDGVKPFPADIYSILDGDEISIANTDPKRGKGVRVLTKNLDPLFVGYLKSKSVVPLNYSGPVNLEQLYWHCLEVTDLDGKVDQHTPIAKAGNTGYVFSQGKQVPDSQKGVPPYPGLHLHFETILKGNKTFNLDKDPYGRIDPRIILDYKGDSMQLIRDKGTVYLVAGIKQKVKTGIASQEVLTTLFGDEPIIDGDTSDIPQSQTASTGFVIHKK